MTTKNVRRFSEKTGIPINHLDHVLVDQITGANRDLAKTYRQLHVLSQLKKAAQESGKSLDDIFMFCWGS